MKVNNVIQYRELYNKLQLKDIYNILTEKENFRLQKFEEWETTEYESINN